MSAARRELYVYYRVAQPHWRDAVLAVQRWQQQLKRRHLGLAARLLRRPEANDGAVTLMEIYALAGHPAGIDAALETELVAAPGVLDGWLIGERHVERFDPVD